MVTIIIRDKQFWRKGELVASPGTWGANHLTASQYENRLIATDDGHLVFAWEFPKEPSPVGIYAYNYVARGKYWEQEGVTQVVPIRCGAVKDFRVDYTAKLYGTANLLLEYFVCATRGDINTRQVEIGYFTILPASTRAFFNAGKLIGQYKSAVGGTWEIRQQMTNGCPNGFLMIVCVSENTPLSHVDAFDCLTAHKFLIEKGLIDPAHHINGVALGAEAIQGPGWMHLSRFKVVLV